MHTIIREQTDPWQHIVILAELGCELCGTYSKDNTPRGFRNRAQSLTTTSNIALFVKRLAHEPGASKLFSAFTWIIDGLHSPMETVLYLMLCLPKWYGGLEFPMPYANSKLDVPQALYPKTRLRHIYPDLFWPEASLIVEYDSEEVHNGREKEDQERQELAQDMGYKVVTFRLSDLKDAKRFEAKARSVAQHLGHALPPTTDKHRALSAKLRNMLIFHERWI